MLGILSAIALPTYQDYTVRAKISQQLFAANLLQSSIAEAFKGGVARNKLNQARYQKDIHNNNLRVENGDIHITLQNTHAAVDGKTLTLHYDGKNWQCHGGGIDRRYLPQLCH